MTTCDIPAAAAAVPAPPLSVLAAASAEELLLPVLVILVVILLTARLFGLAFRRFLAQPAVVGEIAAGLVLGPSVFGRLFPDLWQAVFHPAVAGLGPEESRAFLDQAFTTLSQLGLILLLFLVGLEFDFAHLRWHGPAALRISVAGVVCPFVLGLGVAQVLRLSLPGDVAPLGFSLFVGTALSITAIPILGRILMELGLIRTRLGTITLAAAAVDDAIGWILLAAVSAVVRSQLHVGSLLAMTGATVGFTLLMLVAVRPLLKLAVAWDRHRSGGLSPTMFAVVLAAVLASAVATNLIGIFSIFGAFLVGVCLSEDEEFKKAVSARLHQVVTVFFLPIFFTSTGLRTDVGALDSWHLWGLCLLVSAAAVAGKLGGCALAARWGGFPWRESAAVGVLMNTRALMALVVINVGRGLGVIPDSVFTMLVLMALLTTVMTTPALLWLLGGHDRSRRPADRSAGPTAPGEPRAAFAGGDAAGP